MNYRPSLVPIIIVTRLLDSRGNLRSIVLLMVHFLQGHLHLSKNERSGMLPKV